MPTIEIKKFDVMSVAKIFAVLGAVFGFIMGLIIAAAGAAAGGIAGAAVPGAGAMVGGLAIAAIIILPIVYAIMWFIAAAIGAFLYNIIADRTGGIEFQQ